MCVRELCFGRAGSLQEHEDVQPGKGWNSGAAKGGLLWFFSPGMGFHVRFLLSLRTDRILEVSISLT